MSKNHVAVAAGHRRAADLIETNPEIALPSVGHDGGLFWWLYDYDCPDGVPAMVALIRRAVGGTWQKSESRGIVGEPELVFSREGYTVTVKRDAVCTRRVVGTETITEPAVEAQAERTVEREIVEWDCSPILAEAEVSA